ISRSPLVPGRRSGFNEPMRAAMERIFSWSGDLGIAGLPAVVARVGEEVIPASISSACGPNDAGSSTAGTRVVQNRTRSTGASQRIMYLRRAALDQCVWRISMAHTDFSPRHVRWAVLLAWFLGFAFALPAIA